MLSEQDIRTLRSALDAGKPATVWFTAKAVGVDPGKSGKVLSFAEPAQGDFIEVRPTGSQDTLSFSVAELTMTRPKPRPTPKKPAAPAKEAEPAVPTPPAEVEIYQPAPVEKPAAAKAKPASRRVKVPAEVTVTLHATARGEWTVEVVVGTKRTIRARAVPAVAIAKAAKELPDDVESAISAVLDSARDQHRERIALLQAELDAARRALDDLN
ncbi:DUF6319 family protein [Actinocrispum wychmicini]|uniref:Uncharacterized protein n=1 Tax=Actinocrispum wychmicini TaxID=1213861 RepID=A0A4R2J2B7_9PSEU|nr:DUF6319 family protein [Actinocrispum wychmicini]TCO52441.1 hypothetical protein EV192_112173 [Actinocrispum wychmicini]